VQRMGHTPDDMKADEYGQHKNNKMLHKTGRRHRTERKTKRSPNRQQQPGPVKRFLHFRQLTGRFLFSAFLNLFFLWRRGGDRLDLGWGRWPGDFPLMGDQSATNHIIFHVDDWRAVFLRRQIIQHMADVSRVEIRRLGRHPTGEIRVTNDRHTVIGNQLLISLGQAAVTAVKGGMNVVDAENQTVSVIATAAVEAFYPMNLVPWTVVKA